METYVQDLINSPTLAPLQEEKIEETYEPKNLPKKDTQALAAISKSSITAIESSIGALTHMINNLKVYKDCMIDSINLQVESADIATKYAVNIPQQSHTLPGIISTPQSYDLQGIRTDNERMEQIKAHKDKALSQKRIYLRLAEEDLKVFLQAWKRLQYADMGFEEYLEVLNAGLNPAYSGR